jgi:ketosteroid isomerase-like protein
MEICRGRPASTGDDMKHHAPLFRTAALPALAASALLACAQAQTQTPAESAPTLNAWAAAHNRGDLEALVSEYAPDAIMLPPGGTAERGHDAVRVIFEGTVAQEGVRLDRIAAWADARVATEVGTWEHFSHATGETTSAGTYSVVWRRDDGGTWRIVMNGYAARGAVPAQGADR